MTINCIASYLELLKIVSEKVNLHCTFYGFHATPKSTQYLKNEF